MLISDKNGRSIVVSTRPVCDSGIRISIDKKINKDVPKEKRVAIANFASKYTKERR